MGAQTLLPHTWAFKASPVCLSEPGRGQGGNQEPLDDPLGRPFPVWGLFLGNDQNWESAPTGPGEEVEKAPN